MFLFIGGVVGFLLALFFFVGPAAFSLALALGTSAVWPLQMFTPVISLTFLTGLIGQLVVVLILYIIAAVATPPIQGSVPADPIEELCRGAQIGINACANLLYAAVSYPAIALFLSGAVVAGITAALVPVIALAFGVINFLCVFPGLSRNFAFEAVLGWTSWFMPMSWPLQILGFIVWLIGLVASWFGRPFAALGDWWPGAVARHGWLFNFGRAAFTLGNFTIVSADVRRTSPVIVVTATGPATGFLTALGAVAHETGHTLVVAAFGCLFTLVGWVHERILSIFGTSGHAYFEILCEAIRRVSGDPAQLSNANPWIPMWAPPVTLAGPGGGNGRVVVDATIDGVPVDDGLVVTVGVGTAIDLDASGCSDPDNYPMGTISPGGTPSVGFRWRVTARPNGSIAVIPNATSATTTFTADVAGDYEITLAVTDGAEGEAHSVDVTA
jgi:hypothetical protein